MILDIQHYRYHGNKEISTESKQKMAENYGIDIDKVNPEVAQILTRAVEVGSSEAIMEKLAEIQHDQQID